MAFDINKFQRWSDGMAVGCNSMWSYTKTDETMATIVASAYFNTLIEVTDSTIKVNDIIWIQASDAQQFVTVTSVTAPVTVNPFSVVLGAGSVGTANIAALAVTTALIAADAVTNAKIADDAVSLENLDSGIEPSHVIKFGGQATTVGGAAAEAFAIAGALAASDRAFVQIVNNGTNNVTVLQAVVTNDTLTITFSGDPAADTVFNYQLIRAAS